MDRTEHLRRLQRMLTQVAPQNQLESLGGQPQLEGAGLSEQEFELAKTGLESLTQTRDITAATISDDQLNVLEAIILPRERPAVNIVNNTFQNPPSPWTHLGSGENKTRLERVIPSIGRVEVPNHPVLPYAGTGFVVGTNLLMTNRHVAEIFASGLGQQRLVFKPGLTAGVDFKQEIFAQPGEQPQILSVDKVLMIHPFWDMALLKVSGLTAGHPALVLSVTQPDELVDQDIAVIGYPAQDPRNQVALQNQIFGGVFNVKRLQPGKLKPRSLFSSFGKQVNTVTHDASTLGGNSGSAVINVATGEVVALHFAGIYLQANYSVPTFELAHDSRVVDLGVNFAKPVPVATNAWKPFWDAADTGTERIILNNAATNTPAPLVVGGLSTTWTIPLQVTVTLGTPTMTGGVVAPTGAAITRASGSALDEGMFGTSVPAVIDKGYAKFSLAKLVDTEFSWNGAINGVDASHLVYEEDDTVINQARSKWGFDTCDPVHQDSSHCFVASTPQAILVAFRGTKQFANWLTNLNVISSSQPYGKVHRGFLMAFRSVKARLEALIDSIGTGGRKVVLTGHSLGGALATIAAAEWKGQLPISAVYTYGQPAVGTEDFQTFINANYANKFFRMVNDDDIVPRVPPGYVHVGKLFHFSPGGGVSHESLAAAVGIVDDTPTMSTAEFETLQASLRGTQEPGTTESVGLEGFLPSFSDHKLDQYMQQVLRQLG